MYMSHLKLTQHKQAFQMSEILLIFHHSITEISKLLNALTGTENPIMISRCLAYRFPMLESTELIPNC